MYVVYGKANGSVNNELSEVCQCVSRDLDDSCSFALC